MDEKTGKKPVSGPHPPFEKGNPGGPGRPKGSKGVITDLREMFLAALDQAGGVKYLRAKATSHPNAFMSAVARMLPQFIKTDTEFKVRFPETPAGQSRTQAAQKMLMDRCTSLPPKGGNGDSN
jgi:hypothetical protein